MTGAINPLFPIAAVKNARELMEIAVGMEHEAARRYGDLAAAMARAGETELAELFSDLAELETAHEEGLGRWAVREGIEGVRPARVPWRMPETMGEEADGGEALLLTPYKALAIAVRNEERAFSFFTYLAAIAPDDHVRSLAESLAREELAHVAQLRAMRRRAYHSGSRDHPAELIAEACGSPEAFETIAAGLENGSEELYDLAARELGRQGDEAGATVLREAARLSRLGSPGRALAVGGTLDAAREAGILARGSLTRDGMLRLCLRHAEEVLETYLGVAERADRQDILAQAQQRAESAVARLAMVRSLVPEFDV